jgi:LysR family glycine cleavage system transcriptional activator
MRRLPPLSSLRAFEAAARHLSFKKAAEELAVTPTAISHQIRLLEEVLGQRLFERQTRQVILTNAGQQLFPPLREGLDLIAGAAARVSTLRERASVVVTTTTAFAAHWLVPRLTDFGLSHPGIALSVLASDDIVNLEAGKADLAVRLADSPPTHGKATALFRDRFALVASPSLGIEKPKDLERAVLIQYKWHRPRPGMPSWSRWLEMAGLGRLKLTPQLSFSQESHALQAAIAGHGAALLSLTLASDALRQGLLVQPFPTTIPGQTFYLLQAKVTPASPVDAVKEWLVREAGAGDAVPL